MMTPAGTTLLATVCNTTPNAVPYTLWLARGGEQYLVDLSDTINRPGDGGLTGIAHHADKIYVAVQSSDAPRVMILDHRLTPIGAITSPDFADIHSIHVAGNTLLVCSTGRQSVISVDLNNHQTTKLCEFEAVVHLNAACFDGSELLVCCHYPGLVVPNADGGGIIAAADRRVVLVGLVQPHSLLPHRDGFIVLDSDGERVIRLDHGGIRQQQSVPGFLRGVVAAGNSLFVASSAGRVISRKNPQVPPGRQFWTAVTERVRIHELDADSLAVKSVHHPLIAGFEIYDLIATGPSWALEPARERLIVPDANALSRVYYEAAKRALAQHR